MLAQIAKLNEKLSGTPDATITLAMLLAAGVIIVAAFTASPTTKVAMLTWIIAP